MTTLPQDLIIVILRLNVYTFLGIYLFHMKFKKKIKVHKMLINL